MLSVSFLIDQVSVTKKLVVARAFCELVPEMPRRTEFGTPLDRKCTTLSVYCWFQISLPFSSRYSPPNLKLCDPAPNSANMFWLSVPFHSPLNTQLGEFCSVVESLVRWIGAPRRLLLSVRCGWVLVPYCS